MGGLTWVVKREKEDGGRGGFYRASGSTTQDGQQTRDDMRLLPVPAPSLPQFESLLVYGPYHPSAPIHLCLSTPPQAHAILFSPSRHGLLQGLRDHNDAWLNMYAGTGTVAATSSRVTILLAT